MSSSGRSLRRARDVRYRLLDGEAIVLRQKSSEVIGLNPVGARVLELCDGALGEEEIVEALAGEFEIDRATLQDDVAGFLRELLEIGVIEPIDATAEEER